jgi:hypothetical protein
MRSYKILFCAAVAMSALLSPTLAEEMQMKPGMMMMMHPDGKMMTMPVDDAMSKHMMDKGTAMKVPMMMMMGPDGKMHMMEDMKMSNGKMMSDEMMKK